MSVNVEKSAGNASPDDALAEIGLGEILRLLIMTFTIVTIIDLSLKALHSY